MKKIHSQQPLHQKFLKKAGRKFIAVSSFTVGGVAVSTQAYAVQPLDHHKNAITIRTDVNGGKLDNTRLENTDGRLPGRPGQTGTAYFQYGTRLTSNVEHFNNVTRHAVPRQKDQSLIPFMLMMGGMSSVIATAALVVGLSQSEPVDSHKPQQAEQEMKHMMQGQENKPVMTALPKLKKN